MKNSIKGSFLLFGATLIWGSAFVAQSVGMDLVGPFTFQAFRCSLATVFLLAVIFLFDAGKGEAGEYFKKWKSKELWRTGIICGIALFAAQSLQQIGLVYTDAGKAGFITAMYIVLVPILELFLHKKPSKAAVISVLIAVVGLYMLSCIGVTQINIGDIYLVLCAVGFSVQIMLVDRFGIRMDGLRLNCVQAIVVAVLSTLLMLLTENVEMENVAACRIPIMYAGILSMGVAYSLQILGQKELDPTAASLIMSLESVVAVICGCLILKETMTGWEITGCILVFSAVIISQLPQKSNK